MKKLSQAKGTRNRNRNSSMGAVGGDAPAAPGERAHGSPHGSHARRFDPRRWVDGDGIEYYSYLTLDEKDGLWRVVRVDISGALRIQTRTVLVFCDGVLDASRELASWSEGTGLPAVDYRETFDPCVSNGGVQW